MPVLAVSSLQQPSNVTIHFHFLSTHSVYTTHLEGAVLGNPVPLDEDALVEAGVVQPRLHQAQRVVLQVVEQLHAPHAPSLRPHPVRDNLVEVAEEPEHLVLIKSINRYYVRFSWKVLPSCPRCSTGARRPGRVRS